MNGTYIKNNITNLASAKLVIVRLAIAVGAILREYIMQDIQQIVEQAIEKHNKEEALKYEELKEDIKELKGAVTDLLTMWNQTKGVLSFLKWFVGACASLGVIFAFLRDHLK